MRLYNLIEYSDNYSKKLGILQQHCRNEPAVNNARDDTISFNVANVITHLLKLKPK